MPYICMLRTDIPDGHLQVLDLKPNTSQRSLIYDPPGQTKYVRRPDNDSIGLTGTGPILTTAAADGLQAWLVDNIDNPTGNVALTAAQASDIADALIAILDAGTALTITTVNAAMNGVVAGAGIGNGTSIGTLAELLEVIAGGVYRLPAGSEVEDAANAFVTTQAGSLYASRHIVSSGSFNISRGEGRIAGFLDSNFEYDGVTGAALVLYDDDGTVLS